VQVLSERKGIVPMIHMVLFLLCIEEIYCKRKGHDDIYESLIDIALTKSALGTRR